MAVGSPRSVSLEIPIALLGADVSQAQRDAALIQAITTRTPDEDFVRALIQYQASVNCEEGRPLCEAADLAATNPTLLPLLLNQSPSQDTLKNAWGQALPVEDRRMRLKLLEKLLRAGLTGEPLHVALITVIQEPESQQEQQENTCKLLLQHGASVDFADGTAPRSAANSSRTGTFYLLLRSKAPRETVALYLHDSTTLPKQKGLEVVKALLKIKTPENAMNKLLLSTVSRIF